MRDGLALLVRCLDQGGAQVQLVLLAKELRRRGVPVEVVTFYSGGELEQALTDVGIPIVSLQKSGRWDVFQFAFHFIKYVRYTRPAVVYSFLPDAGLLALLARPALRSCRVAWGIRASHVVVDKSDRLMRLSYWLEARLSCFADAIIANSEAGCAFARKRGFRLGKLHVISNGIDAQRFHFDADERQRLRAEWGVHDDEVVFGLAGRLDPMKDHPTFLRAAALVAKECARARFVFVGGGPESYGLKLRELAQSLNVHHRVIWLGAKDNMPAVNSAFDIGCSASIGEGFSNTIVEAMACERPCIVTEVGDSSLIVGKTGWVVPPGNERTMAAAFTKAVRMGRSVRESLGQAARRRIVAICSVEALCDRTLAVLTPLGLAHGDPAFQPSSPPKY